MDLSSQLNTVVLGLRSGSKTHADRVAKLKHVAFYLPQVGNPQNVWLLLHELALSPGLLDGLDTVLFATDAMTFAANRKARISDPRLPFADWEAAIVRTAYHLPPLFGLIVLSGLCAQGSSREDALPQFVMEVAQNPEMAVLAAGCLSRAQWSPKVRAVFPVLSPACRSLLLSAIVKVVYSPETIKLTSLDDFGGWSRTLARLLELAPFAELAQFLDTLHLFLRTAVTYNSLDALKKLAFGVTIQLEGLMAQLVANRELGEHRQYILGGVVRALQPLAFVIEAVGSQFNSYQFVFYSVVDTLQALAPPARIQILRLLGDHWGYGKAVDSDVAAGDLLFFLEICEPLVSTLSHAESEAFVVPIAERFLDPIPPKITLGPAVFEAAHSVMLAYLATHPTRRFTKSRAALAYFDKLVSLFPAYVSGRQLKSAVAAILRAVSLDQTAQVLDRLFLLAKQTIPGTPIKSGEGEPPTLRAALVSTLLYGVTQYTPAPQMAVWLHHIGSMVPEPYSPSSQAERDFLIQNFRDVVTNLGDVSGVGIRWFFGEGWSRL